MIVVGVIAAILIGWALYSLMTNDRVPEPTGTDGTENASSTHSTATSSPVVTGAAVGTTSGTSTGGLKITNVSVVGKPGMKAYANNQYGFLFAYPEKDAVVIPVSIPASDKTPLLYRKDAEFAFCVKERRTSMGCAPVVTLGLADGSGHGVSVYALINSDVKAYYPKVESNMIIDAEDNIRYEIYYSDTVSIDATPAQNKLRQQIMGEIGASFTLLK